MFQEFHMLAHVHSIFRIYLSSKLYCAKILIKTLAWSVNDFEWGLIRLTSSEFVSEQQVFHTPMHLSKDSSIHYEIQPRSVILMKLNFIYTVSLTYTQSGWCCDMGQNDTIGKIELNPSFILSSDNTNYKNDIQ